MCQRRTAACARHWLWSVVAGAALGCGTVHAQLINCMDPGPNEAFKIFVDDARITDGSAASADMQTKLLSIRKFLTANLRASSGTNGSVRDCGKRYPKDPADFDSTEFDGLDNLRVVLEVWAALDTPARQSGTLGFALVPAHSIVPPAVFVVPSANLLTSLRQGRQVGAFAPLVFGISQFQNRNYAAAAPLLCAGMQQLAGPSALSNPAFLSGQQDLLNRVRGMADKAIQEARKTPGSPYATLTPAADGTFVCPR